MTGPPLPSTDKRITYTRLLFTAALALYGIPLMRHPEAGSFLDAVDLAIHETGHLVFRPFGDVVQFAGGTLFQLIVPIVFAVYFARRRELWAAAIPSWWLAQNLWNISVYVRDARAQELPLVGGGEHDWAFLLGHFGVLAHDQGIADAFHALGLFVWLAAVTAGVLFASTPPVTRSATLEA